jgi:predicted DNA-binding protein (UPF0251 family)
MECRTMPRPCRQRQIRSAPGISAFKPVGVRARSVRWVTLALDEFEAIRLIDHEGCDQEEAATRMGVSRPTVTRVLGRARSKVAEVLIGGLGLRIEGGPVCIGGGPHATCDQTGQGRRRRGRRGHGHAGSSTDQKEIADASG